MNTRPRLSIATRTAETPGLFRVGIFSHVSPVAGPIEGGSVVAWLMRSGHFEMPRSPEQARRIAEYERPKAERELERAASVLRVALAD